MTTTEIAVRENGHAPLAERDVVDGWLAIASDVIKLANVIAETEFVPAEYRDNPPAVAAAILAGRELGIGPMTSLRHVQLVKGTPTLSAEYKRARVLAAGHEFDILELTTTRCRVSGRRRGSTKPPLEITFTMDDARTAGLIKDKGAWRTRPRRMLFARAGSELCDFLFADVVNGLPTAELIRDGATDEDVLAGYDEAPAQAAPEPAPGPRQARRRKPAYVGTVDPQDGSAPVPVTARQAARLAESGIRTDTGLPPLPGEDEDPGPAAPGDPAAGPGTTDRHQHLVGIVRAHFKRLGFEDHEREQRLATTAVIAGVPADLASTTDLTEEQLSAVADTLARCRDRERLIMLLTKGDKQEARP